MSTTAGPGAAEDPAGTPGLLHGFVVQGRVIHALVLRELQTRFGRSQIGFLWLFVEPLMLASAIGLLHWLADHRKGAGIPVFLFYLIGYTPFFAFRAIISRAPSAFHSNMTLMYHRQVRLFDIVLARHLLEAGAVLTVTVAIVVGTALVMETLPPSLPALAGGIVLLVFYAHGLGMLAAAAASVSDVAERMIHPLVYLSLPLSGAFFALHHMPPSFRALVLWNPQANLHEMVRDGMFGDVLPAYYDVPYVLGAVALVNLLGMAALRAVRPRLEF
ncbi:ABC transporter permease [Falsiroseomonas sp. CW058]|uniref:ABC transporter permease n=1 Tax=Falsiroseomonas sp. CW058 TaxID=3388664 RepID=UPI003D322B8C